MRTCQCLIKCFRRRYADDKPHCRIEKRSLPFAAYFRKAQPLCQRVVAGYAPVARIRHSDDWHIEAAKGAADEGRETRGRGETGRGRHRERINKAISTCVYHSLSERSS